MFPVHYFPQLCTLTFTLTRTYFSIPSKSSQTLTRGNLFLCDTPRVWTTSYGTTVIFIWKEREPHQIISIPQRWQWTFMFWVLQNILVCPFSSSGTGYSPNRNITDLEVISILKGSHTVCSHLHALNKSLVLKNCFVFRQPCMNLFTIFKST